MKSSNGKKKKYQWEEYDMNLHILIPVYNEKDNITQTLDGIKSNVRTPHDISVIFDFDEDNTIPTVRDYIEKNPDSKIILLKNDYGRGVLNAIKKGLDSVQDGAALVTMGDCSDDYHDVDKMAEKIISGADMVCGSRYMKGGKQIGGPPLKGLISRIAGLSLNILTGIPTHDISNSFKMYSSDLLKKITIESVGGFEIGLEILVKCFAMNGKIEEIPTTWKDRSTGESRFKLLQWLPRYLHWYFYALKFRWLKS
jgi:glycosyltransferase involved in cell wall biosynthesis